MSIFLGAIKQPIQNRRVTFEEAEKWRTDKLTDIENTMWNKINITKNNRSWEDRISTITYYKLTLRWEKEIMSIMKKHNIFPDVENWAYKSEDVLA